MPNTPKQALIVALLVMITGLFSVRVNAQSSWCHEFSFVGTNSGWTASGPASLQSGGWTSNTSGADGVYITSPVTYFESTFTSVEVTFSASWGGNNPRIIVFDASETDQWGITSAAGNPITVSLSAATGNYVKVVADRHFGGTQYFSGLLLTKIVICGSGSEDPWQPPDATPTPTSTPPPTLTASPLERNVCVAHPRAAVFDSTLWTPFGGASIITAGLLLPPGGSAKAVIPLDLSRKYDLTVLYQASVGDSEDFTLRIARSGVTIATRTDGAVGRFEESGITIISDIPSQLSEIEFFYEADKPDIGLIVKYWCLYDYQERQPEDDRDTKGEECFQCIHEALWDGNPLNLIGLVQEIANVVGWLWCGLRRFLECQLWVILGQIAQAIVNILSWIVGFAEWIVATVGSFISFLLSLVGEVIKFFAAAFSNVIRGIVNVIRGVADFFGNALRGVVNFFRGIAETIGLIIQIVVKVIEVVIVALITIVATVFQWIANIFGVTGTAIQAINDGFNESEVVISGSLTCTDPGGLLYAVCLGFYVLDNTIFNGPGKYLFIVFIGVLSLDTLLWAIETLRRGVLSQDVGS